MNGLTGGVTPTEADALSSIEKLWAQTTLAAYGGYNLLVGYSAEITWGAGLFFQAGFNVNIIDGAQLFFSTEPTFGWNEAKVPGLFIGYQTEPLPGTGYSKNFTLPAGSVSWIQNSEGSVIGATLGAPGAPGFSTSKSQTCTRTFSNGNWKCE